MKKTIVLVLGLILIMAFTTYASDMCWDENDDGVFNSLDISGFKSNLKTSIATGEYDYCYDCNNDGLVNGLDIHPCTTQFKEHLAAGTNPRDKPKPKVQTVSSSICSNGGGVNKDYYGYHLVGYYGFFDQYDYYNIFVLEQIAEAEERVNERIDVIEAMIKASEF